MVAENLTIACRELEKLTGSAIGVLYGRIMSAQFHFADLLTIVRLSLIGSGMDDREAWNLTETYVDVQG